MNRDRSAGHGLRPDLGGRRVVATHEHLGQSAHEARAERLAVPVVDERGPGVRELVVERGNEELEDLAERTARDERLEGTVEELLTGHRTGADDDASHDRVLEHRRATDLDVDEGTVGVDEAHRERNALARTLIELFEDLGQGRDRDLDVVRVHVRERRLTEELSRFVTEHGLGRRAHEGEARLAIEHAVEVRRGLDDGAVQVVGTRRVIERARHGVPLALRPRAIGCQGRDP